MRRNPYMRRTPIQPNYGSNSHRVFGDAFFLGSSHLKIRVDKSTQAVKLVCQTLLRAEPGPGSHTEKKMTTEPNYQ